MTFEPLTSLFLIAALAAWLWYSGSKAREIGTRVAAETCRRQELQFLDDTVALQRLGLARSRNGHLALRRTYRFEYSENHSNRLSGFIIMTGMEVDTVGLAPTGTNDESTVVPFDPDRRKYH